jgi:hypothetical protein
LRNPHLHVELHVRVYLWCPVYGKVLPWPQKSYLLIGSSFLVTASPAITSTNYVYCR